MKKFFFRPSAATAAGTGTDDEEFHDALRPITMEDLVISVNKMKDSKVHTGTLNAVKLDLD